MSKESEAVLLAKIDGLSDAVAALVADKHRREAETANRIEQMHQDILNVFKVRNASIHEMYMAVEITKHGLDESYLDTLKALSEPPAYTKT